MAETLSREACTQAVQELKGWSVAADGKAIAKTFTFKDFTQAFAFMTRIAGVADAADHHPDWRNVYNRVEVTLSTHDAGGVTEKDLSLAKAMEEAAG